MEKKNVIGMIVPTVDNPFFAGLVCHAGIILNDKGYGLLVCGSANSAEKEKENFRMLLDRGAAGILCVSGLSELPSDLLTESYPLLWVD
jgi:LacI family transcriptional regulator